MKRKVSVLAVVAVGFIVGCGGGGSLTQTSTSTSTPPTAPSTPAAPSVTLAETVFVGDEIMMGWPTGMEGQADLGVNQGTITQITQTFGTSSKCESGCVPNGLQAAMEAGAKRVVFLMGTHDVLNSTACGGVGWSGTPGADGDPISLYIAEITGAETLYDVAVEVGTLPPVYGQSGVCEAALSAFNGELAEMAKANSAVLLDFNSAMQTENDFTANGILPNGAGYQVMTAVYTAQ
jgi:hypothetical protein